MVEIDPGVREVRLWPKLPRNTATRRRLLPRLPLTHACCAFAVLPRFSNYEPTALYSILLSVERAHLPMHQCIAVRRRQT